MTPKFVLIRNVDLPKAILGNLFIFDGPTLLFKCKSLEPAWKDNEKGISAVPKGEYIIRFEYSPKFDRYLWELKGVPGRSEIKIHVANYYRQLEGCIAVGDLHTHIDKDGVLDVRNSRNTLNKIHEIMKDVKETTILIC